jgi:hypothetical protein
MTRNRHCVVTLTGSRLDPKVRGPATQIHLHLRCELDPAFVGRWFQNGAVEGWTLVRKNSANRKLSTWTSRLSGQVTFSFQLNWRLDGVLPQPST